MASKAYIDCDACAREDRANARKAAKLVREAFRAMGRTRRADPRCRRFRAVCMLVVPPDDCADCPHLENK